MKLEPPSFSLPQVFRKDISPALIFVALLAGFLGYLIYQQGRQQVLESSPNLSELGEEEEVLIFPGHNATEEERQAHADLVGRLARESEVLEIGECTASPKVLRVKLGESIRVQNQTTAPQRVVLSSAQFYEIPPSGVQSIIIDFKQGEGIYPYGCDFSYYVAGIFVVEE